MELSSVIQFLENRTILVTGATGFLAKIFVEKILRVQPNTKKLYLLIRAPDAKSASQRFYNEVIEKDLFGLLREKHGEHLKHFIDEKIIPVPGDIALNNLGIGDLSLVEEMCKEVEIIVNFAATTKFDERYDVALAINTIGAKYVMNFSRRCAKIRTLLHVSTAYVFGQREGLILEDPLKVGEALNGTPGLDIGAEARFVEERLGELEANQVRERDVTLAMKDLGLQRAKKYGWPNTYVFTKAMGEMVLAYMKEDLPLVILRPTTVTSTFKEPFPGWVEGLKTVDSFVASYGKGKLKCLVGDMGSILDMIPADFVVNAIIVAIAAHANQNCIINEPKVYHVGSSLTNPMKLATIRECALRYFTQHPWVGKEGKAVKVKKVTVISSVASFKRYMTIYYLLPLKILELAKILPCPHFQGFCIDLRRKYNVMMRLMDLFLPYVFYKGIFDNSNTQNLLVASSDCSIEADVFYFDPKIINWEEYLMNIHYPGIVKYLLK